MSHLPQCVRGPALEFGVEQFSEWWLRELGYPITLATSTVFEVVPAVRRFRQTVS